MLTPKEKPAGKNPAHLTTIGAGIISVTVVETMGNAPELRDIIAAYFAEKFGGATITSQSGAWTEPSGKVVIEKGETISAYFRDDNKSRELAKIAAHRMAIYALNNCQNKQDAVIFTVNGIAQLIAH